MLTVLLTVRDVEGTLPRVLEAYGRLEAPEGGWRLLAVDDGSRDGTAALLAARAATLPLRVVTTPGVGLNRARNAAWPHVEGDLVALADGDVVPGPAWLARLREAADARPTFAVFAGPVRPRFEVPPSPLVREVVRPGAMWAAIDRDADGEIDPVACVGANLTLRTAALPPAPVFDDEAGPDGTDFFPMGAETALLHRLRASGARAWFVRAAAVDHLLPARAVTLPWVARRAVRNGRGRYRLGMVRSARRRLGWGGIPAALRFDLAHRRWSLRRAQRSGDETAVARAHVRLAYLAGQALGAASRRGSVDPWEVLRACLPAETLGILAHGESGAPGALR